MESSVLCPVESSRRKRTLGSSVAGAPAQGDRPANTRSGRHSENGALLKMRERSLMQHTPHAYCSARGRCSGAAEWYSRCNSASGMQARDLSTSLPLAAEAAFRGCRQGRSTGSKGDGLRGSGRSRHIVLSARSESGDRCRLELRPGHDKG